MDRFSPELRRRFDVVSFDPRGVGGSNPVICSSQLLAGQPDPVIGGSREFRETLRFNRRLRDDCRARTGPLFDHLDTLSLVRDLDALRAALGESKLTFHGSSYGTLLGQQYAEVFPQRVRALVLESVVDHSLGTRAFLDTQAVAAQDSFDEFVTWCERPESTCELREDGVRTVWADLMARAGAGKLADPTRPGVPLSPFTLSVLTLRQFYGPNWASLARTLAALRDSPPVSGTPPEAPTGTSPYPFAVFCQDWDLPVHNYREYRAHLDRIATLAPEMRYPRALMAVSACLGSPRPVSNPQHRLRVRDVPTILLTNAVHDPVSGYEWALNVARQLGGEAVLLTYEGAGHGTYSSSTCARDLVDAYLISGALPAPGTRCPRSDPPRVGEG